VSISGSQHPTRSSWLWLNVQ